MKVLVSNPNYQKGKIYLPNIFGILKNSIGSEASRAIQWERPINFSHEIKEAKKNLSEVDVLALSNYVWNARDNFKLATELKAVNPNAIVILGGPDPKHEGLSFFEKFPQVDFVVRQDGAQPFAKLIHQILAGDQESSVEGVTSRHYTGEFRRKLRNLEQDLSSYWIENSSFYEPLILDSKARGEKVYAAFETDRGCPYQCSFCDWGSSTFSKVRKFPMSRVLQEIEWLGFVKVEYVVITNANFGIFERDIEIASAFAQAKNKFGFPRKLAYSLPKSNLKHSFEIVKILAAADMLDYNSLPVQSTNSGVLKAVRRKNINNQEFQRFVDLSDKLGFPASPQIVLGLPDDSYPMYLQSLADVFFSKTTKGCTIYPFLVLPNAPANRPEYRSQYDIQTISRLMVNRERDIFAEYCVATRSFDQSEYIQMWLAGSIYCALIDSELISHLVQLLLRVQVSIPSLLDRLLNQFFLNDQFPVSHKIFDRIHSHAQEFVFGQDRRFPRQIDVCFEKTTKAMSFEEYLLFSCVSDWEPFLNEMRDFVKKQWLSQVPDDILDDLFDLMKDSLISESFEFDAPRRKQLRYNWKKFFSQSESQIPEFDPKSYGLLPKKIESDIDWSMKNESLEFGAAYFKHCLSMTFRGANPTRTELGEWTA